MKLVEQVRKVFNVVYCKTYKKDKKKLNSISPKRLKGSGILNDFLYGDGL